MNKGWTYREGLGYLSSIQPLLSRRGFGGRIIGSVAEKGSSLHDLDILLTPTRGDSDFEPLMDELPFGNFTFEMESYEYFLPDGRVVDLWFEEKL